MKLFTRLNRRIHVYCCGIIALISAGAAADELIYIDNERATLSSVFKGSAERNIIGKIEFNNQSSALVIANPMQFKELPPKSIDEALKDPDYTTKPSAMARCHFKTSDKSTAYIGNYYENRIYSKSSGRLTGKKLSGEELYRPESFCQTLLAMHDALNNPSASRSRGVKNLLLKEKRGSYVMFQTSRTQYDPPSVVINAKYENGFESIPTEVHITPADENISEQFRLSFKQIERSLNNHQLSLEDMRRKSFTAYGVETLGKPEKSTAKTQEKAVKTLVVGDTTLYFSYHRNPIYPSLALSRGISGECTATFDVSSNGRPYNVQITSCTSRRYFMSETIRTIESYRFQSPGREITGAEITLTYNNPRDH